MSLSAYEVTALCKKAAKGAGYSWGMAEEVGVACVFLCRMGIDGTQEFADYLSALDGALPRDFALRAWPAEQASICPFSLGCYLADGEMDTDTLALANVRAPIFLMPFLSRCAGVERDFRILLFDGSYLTLDPMCAVVQVMKYAPAVQSDIIIYHRNVLPYMPSRPEVWPETEHPVLLRFAAKTYVRESEKSRAHGAG